MTASLTIGDQRYDPADLLAGRAGQSAQSDNAGAALDFCRRWLDGADEFVVQTSGSTGAPKPITLRREQMIASAQATGEALRLQAGMAALVCLPVRYIAGQMMLVRGLVLGLAMTLVEPANDPLAGLPCGAAFDFTAVVPLQLQSMLDGPAGYKDRLNTMHAILVGGAALSAALEGRVRNLAPPIYHTYGMTETATHVALRRLNGPDASPLFHPLPGVETGADERGCLRVKGPMTLNQWVQTNDLVELASPPSLLSAPHSPAPALAAERSAGASVLGTGEPGSPLPTFPFRWLGRWDNVINSGGVKVQVERVEAAVERAWAELGLPPRRFFVAGLPDDRLGEVVATLVEGEPLGAAAEAAIRAELRSRLQRFEAPRRIVYLAKLAETPTGKIDRGASVRLLPGLA